MVEPGDVFVAISGLRVDGHRFIPAAVEAGATAVVGERSRIELASEGVTLPETIPYLQVVDAREALAVLNAALHRFPSRSLTVIGVTGTDGKTTTCMLLESILSQVVDGAVGVITTVGARIRGVEQPTGLHVTTPDAPQVQAFLAAMRDAGCRYAIVESTSHGLDQRRVAAVDFDAAVVTNITHEHLDYHGSYEAYRAAKARLFQALFRRTDRPGTPRLAVLNRDDPGSYSHLQRVLADESARPDAPPVQVLEYALESEHADVWATDVVYKPGATEFILHWWGEPFPVTTRLIGSFNVANILAASTVALGLGASPEAVQQGVARLPGVLGRMERMEAGQDFLAVVDFAHSPVSLERALLTLRPLVGEGGRLIAVFGSAGLRDRAKRRLMGEVSGRLADFTIITAEDPRTEDLDAINQEIAAGVRAHAPEDRFCIVPDRAEAIQMAVDMARAGDVVASFGKGHERSMCFGEIEYPWNEQEVMLQALRRRLAASS